MLPPQFDYAAPTSIREAAELLASRPDARFDAGSYKLIIDLKMRRAEVGLLVDLRKLTELYGIAPVQNGVEIGAMTSLKTLMDDGTITASYPALAAAAALTGDPQIRNMAALGGVLSYEGSTSAVAAPLLAFGAVIYLHSVKGQRALDAADFFLPGGATALRQNEIITMIALPTPAGNSAYEQYTNPATLGAYIAVAAVMNDGTAPTLGISGTVGQALRIAGGSTDLSALDWLPDLHVSADYRAARLGVMVQRALDRL